MRNMNAQPLVNTSYMNKGIRFLGFTQGLACGVCIGYIIAEEEPGSSVSIVSDYGLDNRTIGVRSPAVTKDFSSNLCVQTGSEAHPASCTKGTRGPFPGAKRGKGVTLTTHPI
jgi:hypothetical protein